jgi:hypothetical protein
MDVVGGAFYISTVLLLSININVIKNSIASGRDNLRKGTRSVSWWYRTTSLHSSGEAIDTKKQSYINRCNLVVTHKNQPQLNLCNLAASNLQSKPLQHLFSHPL